MRIKKFWAKIEDNIEEFDELPKFKTYFMYGNGDSTYAGQAMLMGQHSTPIYESSTNKVYQRPEYAGFHLKDIDNFQY